MNRAGSEKQISVDPTESSPPKIMSSRKNSSRSLPSSPRFIDSFLRKHKAQTKVIPWTLARQHSVALSNLEHLRESRMSRSKSCGEGRACPPSIDFDLRSTNNHQTKEDFQTQQQRTREGESDKFKCGACLFIPGFGKGKTVRLRKEVDNDNTVTQRVSLEKFECGSWRSPAIINYEKDDDNTTITTSNLFFDLPVELMRFSSVNDTESPITSGFVFDKEDHHHHTRKGVLKSATSIGRKSEMESFNSSRRVRFSSSSLTLCPTSPTSPCTTPRLRMTRDDFNTFIEAQSA